jgi:NTE family protein
VTLGQPFQFTQDQFDFLQSDLSAVRVARAVTASSAVPVALSPIGLRVYHGEPNFALPDWITQQMASPDYPSLAWQQANQMAYYLDPAKSEYVHLVDGGITDNLGVRPILSPPREDRNDLSVRQMVDITRVQHMLFIMVNAANQPDSNWTRRAHPPGALAVLGKAIGGLMSNTSASMARALRKRLVTAREIVAGRHMQADITVVEVGFTAVPVEERSYFLNVATSLGLSTETYDRLIEAGARLVADSPDYQRFVAMLGGSVTPSPSSGH